MSTKKVFVTGVAGFLGSHLADRMLERGHEVSGIDNMLGGYEDNVSDDVEFFNADARDFEKLRPLIRGAEVVYHCAAAPHEGLSVFSPNIITTHTYNSTVAVVSAAVAEGVKRIVFCSSMARYGNQGNDGGIFTEEMRPQPVDPYGIAKFASELFTETMCRMHGLEYVIVVPHNIFGTRQKYDDPFRNVLSIMTNRMLRGEQPIIYGDGEQRRSFTFIRDAVTPFERTGFTEGLSGETINVGPDEEFVTINVAARTVADVIGFKLNPIYMPPRPLEVKHASCSAEKARRLLEYQTTTSFEDGVYELVEWIKERGPRPFTYHLPLEIVNEKTPKTWSEKLM